MDHPYFGKINTVQWEKLFPVVLIWDDFLNFIFFPGNDQNDTFFKAHIKGRNEETGLYFQASVSKNFGPEGL